MSLIVVVEMLLLNGSSHPSASFPPTLWDHLKMFNASQSQYLICHHKPAFIIKRKGFQVELIAQSNSLGTHGGKESYTGYIYGRIGPSHSTVVCDEFHREAYELVQGDRERLCEVISQQVHQQFRGSEGCITRKHKVIHSMPTPVRMPTPRL